MQKYKKKWKYNYGLMTKKTLPVLGSVLLSYQDSNLDKQNQNLMCYHYTIGQSIVCANRLQKYYFFAEWTNFFCPYGLLLCLKI